MLRASLGKVVHTVKRAGTYAAKVPPQELHKIAVHVQAVVNAIQELLCRDTSTDKPTVTAASCIGCRGKDSQIYSK